MYLAKQVLDRRRPRESSLMQTWMPLAQPGLAQTQGPAREQESELERQLGPVLEQRS